MPNVVISEQWYVGGVLTNLDASPTLCDSTGLIAIYDNTAGSTALAASPTVTMLPVAGVNGTYQYTWTGGIAGHTYTAYRKCVYGGATYILPQTIVLPSATTPAAMTCNYTSLVNRLGWQQFGLRPNPTSGDVISQGVANSAQAVDILNCIQDGLAVVYNAWRWSFLRPTVPITTYAPYSTGTIAVTSGGVATLNAGVVPSDGGFPSYAASAGGQLWIGTAIPPTFFGNTFNVSAWSSATSITLQNVNGASYSGPTFSAGTPYTMYFNTYPMPTGFNGFENTLTFPGSIDADRQPLQSVDEVMIRRYLERDNVPHKPRMYATIANTFAPTVGSTKSVMFYPIPDNQYILTGKAVLQQIMLDATNQYPLGVDVLAPVIMESVLAAAERNLDQIHPGSAEAVHNTALQPLLAMAIQRDKEYASPDTLGIDHGQEGESGPHRHHRRPSSIFWNAGGGYDGYV